MTYKQWGSQPNNFKRLITLTKNGYSKLEVPL